ncbi:hypothetical protein [Paraburkholderia phenoliruptrix]|uniref:hypothetical protein n=1 Tax=Paraburkholderia phenoliruptrix TaxID=252970 RepID=UPI00285F58CB|nr:hypothetical protein [Paraburkholderia phenoliruptrix]MDR6389154.1 hypothetical protein [Paraburkholderia phenoliruptrix]
MSDETYQALQAAINIARFEQVRCVSTLKRLLIQRGHEPDHVHEAVHAWANYEKGKQC